MPSFESRRVTAPLLARAASGSCLWAERHSWLGLGLGFRVRVSMWLEQHAGQGRATRGKPRTRAQGPKSTSYFLRVVVPLRTTYLERRHERVVHVRAGPGELPLKLAVFDTKRGVQGGAPEHLVRVRVRVRVRVGVIGLGLGSSRRRPGAQG